MGSTLRSSLRNGAPRSYLGVYNWTASTLFLEAGGGYERT
jgi:hypothetical protein